uniref:Uncharacterized protein n=1 Tax=Panagrolaimus sp. ES5 TaxID=591445 RepID=A0AC34GV94_9BILA
MNTKSGLNISNIVKIVQKVDSTETTEREKAVDTICRYIEDSVRLQKVRREGSSYTDQYLTMGLLHGSYLANYVKIDKEDAFLFREYCDKIINADGVIVLKMIGGHSNELFSQEILISLWKKFNVMGAHVQVPVGASQMGTRHRDVSITLTPQMNFDDADVETSEIDTPLLRP